MVHLAKTIPSTIADQAGIIQEYIDNLTDGNGRVMSGAESTVKYLRGILNDYENVGKTKDEKSWNNLENYFTASTSGSAMKSYLESIVKSGGSAQDALNAFRASGMRLKDINVSSDGVATAYWTRSPNVDYNGYYYRVEPEGTLSGYYYAYSTNGIRIMYSI